MPGTYPADPAVRGPVISFLTQVCAGGGDIAIGGDDAVPDEVVTVPDLESVLVDLYYMFLLFVREAEEKTGKSPVGAFYAVAGMFAHFGMATEKEYAAYGVDFAAFLQRQGLAAYDAGE